MDGRAFHGSFPHARQLSDVVRSSAADEALCARGTFGETLLHARQLSDVVRSNDGGGTTVCADVAALDSGTDLESPGGMSADSPQACVGAAPGMLLADVSPP